VIPVLTYYQLLQSRSAVGGSELERDLSNLRNPATMRANWGTGACCFGASRQRRATTWW
jgi:hypothetical protein